MALHKERMGLLRFIATDPRLVEAGTDAAMLYLKLVFWTEDFGARHPEAGGDHWPSDAMLARRCGLTIEAYRAAVEQLQRVGLYQDEGQGGFALHLPVE